MIKYTELVTEWSRVNDVTNNLAEVIKVVKDRMQGKGISPAEVPIIMSKLQQVEDRLRQIGSNPDKLVPNHVPIKVPLDI